MRYLTEKYSRFLKEYFGFCNMKVLTDLETMFQNTKNIDTSVDENWEKLKNVLEDQKNMEKRGVK